MEVIFVIVFIAAIWYLYRASNRTFTVELKAYTTREEAMDDGHLLSENGFDQEVVGESHYQSILVKIVDSLPDGYDFVQATLELEHDNPHDKNAVAVKIASRLVGHLPRAAAKEYRRLAKIKNIPEVAPCPAIIRGSADTNYGVWLGLPELV